MTGPSHDPFEFRVDTRPKGKLPPSRGYRPKPTSVYEQLSGPDPEVCAEARKTKPKAAKPDDEFKRVLADFKQRGWLAFRVEAYVCAGGAFIKKDLLGFADILALRLDGEHTRVLAVQLTTKGKVLDHIRKMASSDLFNVPGSGQISYRHAVCAWLATGASIVILAWDKDDKGRWFYGETPVTIDTISEAIARRRKVS